MDEFVKTGIRRIVIGVLWLLHGVCLLSDSMLFSFAGVFVLFAICFIDVRTMAKQNKKERIKEYDLMKVYSEAFYRVRLFILGILVIGAIASLAFGSVIKIDIGIVISAMMGVMDILVGIGLLSLERELRLDSESRISNYEAIVRMNVDELECCLDDIFVAGMNEGMYAVKQDEETMLEIIGDFPFNKSWLEEKAESAVFHRFDSDEEDLKDVMN